MSEQQQNDGTMTKTPVADGNVVLTGRGFMVPYQVAQDLELAAQDMERELQGRLSVESRATTRLLMRVAELEHEPLAASPKEVQDLIFSQRELPKVIVERDELKARVAELEHEHDTAEAERDAASVKAALLLTECQRAQYGCAVALAERDFLRAEVVLLKEANSRLGVIANAQCDRMLSAGGVAAVAPPPSSVDSEANPQ